jgi:hypothetical protein
MSKIKIIQMRVAFHPKSSAPPFPPRPPPSSLSLPFPFATRKCPLRSSPSLNLPFAQGKQTHAPELHVQLAKTMMQRINTDEEIVHKFNVTCQQQ